MASLPAWAAEETDVASALDEDDPFDLHVTVDYVFSARRAAIKRESTAIAASAQAIASPSRQRRSTG